MLQAPHAVYCRHKPDETLDETFTSHIWMMNRFLEQSQTDITSLQLYVVATCYRKILLRMNHHVSESFQTALKTLPQTLEFSMPSHNSRPSEMMRDREFLSTFLPNVIPYLTTKIPTLMQEIDHAKTLHDDYQLNFNTKEICLEFHSVLCELLEHFHKALNDLNNLRMTSVDVVEIDKQLMLISQIGITLNSMAKGAAIKKHLQVIADFLPDRAALVKQTEGNHQEEEEDTALQIGQPGALNLPKWKACSDWLELMVVHFNAVQVLAHYVMSVPQFKLEIKILSHALPDRNMLPWKDLLHHKTYFPQIVVDDIISFLDPDSKPFVDTTRISNTQTEKITAQNVVMLVKALRNIPRSDTDNFTKAADFIIDQVERLTDCTSPESELHTESIVARLKDFKGNWLLYTQDRYILEEVPKIVEMIETLRDNTKLYESLGKDSALSTGIGFRGTNHCAVALAAFCSVQEAGLSRFVSH
jgi:hypothetical protein